MVWQLPRLRRLKGYLNLYMPQENTIRSVLFNEVTRLVAIVSIVVGVVFYIGNIRTDVALIRSDINTINTNHLSHIQDELTAKTKVDEAQTAEIISIGKNIEKILTLLDEKK